MGSGGRLQGKRKEKKKSSCFVIIDFELMLFIHILMSPVHALFFGKVINFTERNGFLELRVICEDLMINKMVSNDIQQRCGLQDEKNEPQH